MPPINYFIVDDHPIFRQGLRLALEDDDSLNFMGEAGDGRALLELLQQTRPDVILMDLKMPVMDGIEATKEVRKLYPGIKIIILTMNDDEQLILHLLEAGANGYMVKNSDADEIKLALHACNEAGFYFSDYISHLMVKALVRKNAPVATFQNTIDLTTRELEVLGLICEGLSAIEMGKKIFLSHRTIEGIRRSLQDKIGVRNNAGLIVYAVKNGIVS